MKGCKGHSPLQESLVITLQAVVRVGVVLVETAPSSPPEVALAVPAKLGVVGMAPSKKLAAAMSAKARTCSPCGMGEAFQLVVSFFCFLGEPISKQSWGCSFEYFIIFCHVS